MSRLSNALECLSLGARSHPSALLDIGGKIDYLDNNHAPYGAWRFSVRLGVEVALPRNFDADAQHHVRRDMVQQITQYAFGEFLEPMMIARRRAYEIGDLTLVEMLNSIMDKMFRDS